MADLIDREKTERILYNIADHLKERNSLKDILIASAIEGIAIETIHSQPAVDAVPVVHAHWEKVRIPCLDSMGFNDWKRGYKCTNCQTESRYFRKTFKRCPECGARMDEEG